MGIISFWRKRKMDADQTEDKSSFVVGCAWCEWKGDDVLSLKSHVYTTHPLKTVCGVLTRKRSS